MDVKLWGVGGSASDQCEDPALGGGGGGFTSGCLAVTPGQTFRVIVGEGGIQVLTTLVVLDLVIKIEKLHFWWWRWRRYGWWFWLWWWFICYSF